MNTPVGRRLDKSTFAEMTLKLCLLTVFINDLEEPGKAGVGPAPAGELQVVARPVLCPVPQVKKGITKIKTKFWKKCCLNIYGRGKYVDKKILLKECVITEQIATELGSNLQTNNQNTE